MSGDFDLSGKVCVVTGALGLLGKEHCRALADHGARVVALDVSQPDAEAFAETLREASGQPMLGLGVDVCDKAALLAALAEIEAKLGPVSVLLNNAAINDKFEDPLAAAEQSKFENYPLDQWQRSFDVGVTGMFLCCQVFGPPMAERGQGSIINVASTYGMVGPDQSIYRQPDGTQNFFKTPSYPATKGAVLNFTRFLAAYWGHRGVRVNTLSPGGVEAGQDAFFIANYSQKTPLGHMASARDYRGAVVFLASDASAYMTGANLVVDGGWTAW